MKNLIDNHFIGLMIVLWILYIIPILIASYRKCKHINGIALVNILLGTTILGWIGALVWAVSDSKDQMMLKKHRLWIYLSFAVLALGLTSSIYIYQNMYNKPHDDIEKASPAYSVSTEEIWSKYNTDRETADSLYNNQVIEVTGNLSRIDKNDTLVSAIFVMAADSMFGDKTIACQMYKKHNEEAGTLVVGAKVKIKGVCIGYDDTDIKFNKCSIVK
jgi:hypothetical protein